MLWVHSQLQRLAESNFHDSQQERTCGVQATAVELPLLCGEGLRGGRRRGGFGEGEHCPVQEHAVIVSPHTHWGQLQALDKVLCGNQAVKP